MNLTEILTAIKQIDSAKDQIISGLEAHIKQHSTLLTDAQAEIDGAKALIAKVKGEVKTAESSAVAAVPTKLFTKPATSSIRWYVLGAAALIIVYSVLKHLI